MKKVVLLMMVLFMALNINAQNTGESQPVLGAFWKTKANGWISEWVYKNVQEDGWYRITSASGEVDTVYVEIIDSSQTDFFMGKYFENEYADRNRNWFYFPEGSRIWFTSDEYYSYSHSTLYTQTTGTHAMCGNGVTVRMYHSQAPVVQREEDPVDNNRFATLDTQTQPATQYQPVQYVETVDPCSELQSRWALVQANYDNRNIDRSTAETHFQVLINQDVNGCLASMEPHFRNTGQKILTHTLAVAGGFLAGYLISNNNSGIRTIPHTEPVFNQPIPHTEPRSVGIPTGRESLPSASNSSSGLETFYSIIGE